MVAIVVALVIAVLFYMRAPSSARVHANTGALSFRVPAAPDVASRLSWSVDGAEVCELLPSDDFSLDASAPETRCVDTGAGGGSLWFDPGLNVSLAGLASGVEVLIDRVAESDDAGCVTLRLADGSVQSLCHPVRVVYDVGAAGDAVLLPVVSHTVSVGEEVFWQTLSNRPVLFDGDVQLTRESVFGDDRFASEQFDLIVGDFVELRGDGPNYIQGLVHIADNKSMEVAVTVSAGEAVLKRMSRDPITLDAPFASHLMRDPTLIATWALLTLVGAGVLALFEVGLIERFRK